MRFEKGGCKGEAEHDRSLSCEMPVGSRRYEKRESRYVRPLRTYKNASHSEDDDLDRIAVVDPRKFLVLTLLKRALEFGHCYRYMYYSINCYMV